MSVTTYDTNNAPVSIDFDAGQMVEVVTAERIEPHALDTEAARNVEAPPFYGFCPQDVAQVERPSLVTVVNDRIAELADRAQRTLQSDGNPY